MRSGPKGADIPCEKGEYNTPILADIAVNLAKRRLLSNNAPEMMEVVRQMPGLFVYNACFGEWVAAHAATYSAGVQYGLLLVYNPDVGDFGFAGVLEKRQITRL